jgi:tetratricopeptide (TPR) repeat protein/TolB-like protein
MGIRPELRELAQRLFEGAWQRKPEERASYLENACPTDPALREYILRMVASNEKDSTFLETPFLMQVLSWPLLEEGHLIEGRFRIVRLIGRGGMGEVYEAEDAQSGERVALKIVRRDLSGLDETTARLRREIVLVHKIGHPNVCKVHYLGVDARPEGDLLFLTMDLLEGETLLDRIRREGSLPPKVAFAIARQIAAGLDCAHQEGIVHQDLKSSNIMLVPRKDGMIRAVITDFGIACTQDEEDFGSATAGTPAYMAPERLTEPGAKPPIDIYAFGVILYEMITGRLPFDAVSALEQQRRPPPAPSTINRGVGWKWDRAILRCLDRSPEKRFAQASDAVDALETARWPIPLAAVVLVVLLAYRPVRDWIRWITSGPVQVVAFLPFEITGEALPWQGLADYLAEQLQQNVIIRGKWLVFAPAEVRQVGVNTAEQAKQALGASHVMAGTITRESRSVTIAGRLVETKKLRPIGAFQKTCPLDNVVCLQEGMLLTIAGVLAPQGLLSPRPAPISNEALGYYLQALDYLNRDSVSYNLAIPLLQQAMAKDPSAILPQVALADAYMLRFRDTNDRLMLAASRKILDQVLATHPVLLEAHALLGTLDRWEGRYETAARHLLLAVQADPSNHIFHLRLGMTYYASGQDADAITEFEKALQLQPRYWQGYLDYAVFHHRRGRFREAATLLEQFLQWAPDHAQALAALGGIYVDMGRNADAERVSAHSCLLQPGRTCYTNLGIALQRQRRTYQAIDNYKLALGFGARSEMLLLNMADAYAYLGDRVEAHEFFRRAADQAQESLKINLQDSGKRAILAYCLAQLGDQARAVFELEQALQSAPNDKNVRKYGVLTYEGIGQRDKALETLRGATRQVVEELEFAWGTERLRQDPRYHGVTQEVKSR